jgi:hypothetical protein
MSDLLDKKIMSGLTFRHIILMLSGLVIASSAFITWFTYSNLGNPENLNGIKLSQTYPEFPEILALPVIGAAIFFGALIVSRHEEFTAVSNYPKYLAILLAAIALVLSIETLVRLQLFIQTKIGISFVNNVGFGCYFAGGGAVFALIIAAFPRKQSARNKSRFNLLARS